MWSDIQSLAQSYIFKTFYTDMMFKKPFNLEAEIASKLVYYESKLV